MYASDTHAHPVGNGLQLKEWVSKSKIVLERNPPRGYRARTRLRRRRTVGPRADWSRARQAPAALDQRETSPSRASSRAPRRSYNTEHDSERSGELINQVLPGGTLVPALGRRASRHSREEQPRSTLRVQQEPHGRTGAPKSHLRIHPGARRAAAARGARADRTAAESDILRKGQAIAPQSPVPRAWWYVPRIPSGRSEHDLAKGPRRSRTVRYVDRDGDGFAGAARRCVPAVHHKLQTPATRPTDSWPLWVNRGGSRHPLRSGRRCSSPTCGRTKRSHNYVTAQSAWTADYRTRRNFLSSCTAQHGPFTRASSKMREYRRLYERSQQCGQPGEEQLYPRDWDA